MLTIKIITNAFLDVLFLMFTSAEIAIKHGLQISIMSLVAGSLVIDRVGEKSVEAKTYQEGFAYLNKMDIYVMVGIMIAM